MEVFGLNETISAIQDELNDMAKKARNAVKLAGQAYANDVKVLAPYDTGTYRRSIHVQNMIEEGGKDYAIIGTDLPQAKRLEFGFWDKTDSLGRHFMQYPRPHFRPPLDSEIDKYVAIMKGELESGGTSFSDEMKEGMTDMLIGAANYGIAIPKATRKKKPVNIWSKVSTTHRRSSPGRGIVKK